MSSYFSSIIVGDFTQNKKSGKKQETIETWTEKMESPLTQPLIKGTDEDWKRNENYVPSNHNKPLRMAISCWVGVLLLIGISILPFFIFDPSDTFNKWTVFAFFLLLGFVYIWCGYRYFSEYRKRKRAAHKRYEMRNAPHKRHKKAE
ncbi:MAG: hypothetical protein FWF49_02060 [Oscillospiraceae bacterium]|nr:hypothetical protein [Oscillospiraceae bacterium]